MTTINILTLIYMIIAVLIVVRSMQFPKNQEIQNTKMNGKHFSIVCTTLLVGFLLRVILSAINPIHEYDMNCFTYWSDAVYKNGFGNFYGQDFFADYPPGYMYILWIIGNLRSSFPVLQDSILLIKLPAILLDLAICVLIYKIARKKYSDTQATLWMTLYLFHPVVLIDSSIWGQCDSVLAFFGLLFCYLITEKKLISSYFVFAIGILMKPQMLMLAPILLCGIYQHVLRRFKKKDFFKHLGAGLLAILFMIVAVIPYNLALVWEQYQSTLSSYPYASYNGYNFWTFLHLNFKPQTDTLFSLPFGNPSFSVSYEMLGTFSTVLLVVFVLLLCIKNVNKKMHLRLDSYYFYAALIVCVFFTMSVRMHERYMYSALVFLLVAFMSYPIKGLLFAFFLATFVEVNNIWYVFRFYDINAYDWDNPFPRIIGAFCVFLCIFMLYLAIRYYWNESRIVEENRSCYDKKFNWICSLMFLLYIFIIIIFGDLTKNARSNSTSKNSEQPQITSVAEEESSTPVPMLDNVTMDEYEDYSYAGYIGTMTYCYRDGAPYYHKWHTNFPKKKSANEAYKKICSEFEGQYGTGEVSNVETDEFYTTSWKTDTEEITVQNMKTDSSYEVSFIVTEK